MTDAVQNTQYATRNTWEYRGNIHMHTVHSDGAGEVQDLIAAANKVGHDYIIITDHNTLVDQSEEGWRDGVLTLLDSEIHDVDLVPERNHCLTLNVHKDMTPYAPSPQGLIDAVREHGGLTFLAHPVDYPSPAVPVSFEWTAWDIEGFTGIELWNFMSEFRPPATSMAKAIMIALVPQYFSTGPYPELLAKWDGFLQQRSMPAIGGSDAHALVYNLGPLRKRFLPYEYAFRAVNTHVLTPEPFNHTFEHDRALLYAALRDGRAWVGYDMVHPTDGFHFSARTGATAATMGDSIQAGEQITFEIETPASGHIKLIRAGDGVIAETQGERLSYVTSTPGAYRVEVWKRWWFKSRGWIFSNPIYVV